MDALGFLLLELTSCEREQRQLCLARAGTLAKTRWAKLPAALTGWQPTTTDDAPPAALKKLVQETGIPHSERPAKWLAYSGGLRLKEANGPGHFARLKRVAMAQLRSPHVEGCEIAALLANAFPTHSYLSTMRGARHVLCLLKVYEQHSEAAAAITSQAVHTGVASVAAFLLALYGPEAEEDAFWTMVGLLEERIPRSCVLENASNTGLDQRVLEALLAQGSHKLTGAFAAADAPLGATTAPWFRALFTTALPAEACARVWDSLVLEGPKVIFRVALALFKMHEPALVSGGKTSRVAQSLRWRVARTYNADTLMKVACANTLPLAVIKRARADYERAIEGRLKEQRAQLENLRATITATRQQAQGNAKAERILAAKLEAWSPSPHKELPHSCATQSSALLHAIEHEAECNGWATGLWTSAIRAWHNSQLKTHQRAHQAV